MAQTNDNLQQEVDNRSVAEPVSEAVLIRRQAQTAEKELAVMKAERDRLHAENQTLRENLHRVQMDQQIRQAAQAAGAIDSDTVCLLIRQQMDQTGSSDIPMLLERLGREKSWLFVWDRAARTSRTAGQRVLPDRTAALEQAAGKAERSGRLNDVQEYLRVRRQFT